MLVLVVLLQVVVVARVREAAGHGVPVQDQDQAGRGMALEGRKSRIEIGQANVKIVISLNTTRKRVMCLLSWV